jgi:hypothetical protein
MKDAGDPEPIGENRNLAMFAFGCAGLAAWPAHE